MEEGKNGFVKQVTKEVTKDITKKLLKKHGKKVIIKFLPALLPIIGVVGLMLLILVLILAVVSAGASGSVVQSRFQFRAIPSQLLIDAYNTYDSNLQNNIDADFCQMVTYTLIKGGVENYSPQILQDAINKIKQGNTLESLLTTKDEKESYDMYLKMVQNYVGSYVGVYSQQVDDGKGGKKTNRHAYIKNFFPIPESCLQQTAQPTGPPQQTRTNFTYTLNNDFGDDRSYNNKKSSHDGNDIIAVGGTPICAVEDGNIENVGWNEMGGYRIGIRSLDGKKYYYYAHMLVSHPYAKNFQKGDYVAAGDVIGFVGASGYGAEGTTGQFIEHLHYGLQIKYDLGQLIQGQTPEYWVDPNPLLKFLEATRKANLIKNNEYDYVRDKTGDPPV